MSGRSRKRTQIAGQFAPRTIEMLRSPAYRALSLSEHRILARLEIELADHGGTGNGKLMATFDDFHRYGIHRHAIAPGLRAAEALGFIVITERGRAGNGEWRKPNQFRLTYRHTDRDEPTNDWQKIESSGQAERLAAEARKNKKPVTVNANFGDGNRTTNGHFHGAKTVTTVHGAESITTSDISGRVANAC
jgi:hypothetical protein